MPTAEETAAAEAEATAATAAAAAADDAGDNAGAESLGDAGKKALDSMKAKWRAAETAAKDSATEFAAYKATAEGREAEHKLDQDNQKVRDDALSAANQRILKAEVRAAAATKLADPADALRFLDLSSFEVGEDGEIDAATVASAIDDLIASKPYLAAQGGKRFQGSADGGARNDAATRAQFTQSDLDRMTPEQVVTARKSGQLNTLMGITS